MRWLRRALVGTGVVVMAYGLVGAVITVTNPVGHLLFLAAVLLLHDGLLMPIALAVGALAGRLVPAGLRAVIAAAAYVSGSLVVVALPLVLGFGRTADEPSALPLNYARGLLVALAAVWLAALACLAARRLRPARPHKSAG